MPWETIPRLLWSFIKIGLFSFGGGYAMLPLVEMEVIEKGWLSAQEFVDIIAIAEMTPGTIAINTATFTGYRIAGLPGAITATIGVILPSLIIGFIFADLLLKFRDNPTSVSIFKGLRPAFIALIIMASLFIARNSLVDMTTVMIFAVLLGVGLLRRTNPFYIIIIGAILGLILYPS
ncbi:MAG: chromate transporter [Firmicutes bacterium]|jgi:chromate transporter|nr:chromate transporter [Bacillota bacterium]